MLSTAELSSGQNKIHRAIRFGGTKSDLTVNKIGSVSYGSLPRVPGNESVPVRYFCLRVKERVIEYKYRWRREDGIDCQLDNFLVSRDKALTQMLALPPVLG
ncbi:hypothetical protein [Paenibacillus sp. FSL H8-0332]|uniref:hypothetical protein n=1 Tax=Paenibacillus sp. FSL H8-0332 TaxID=2954742 RepID=UPI0030CCA5E6